jgi:hypothetical protein
MAKGDRSTNLAVRKSNRSRHYGMTRPLLYRTLYQHPTFRSLGCRILIQFRRECLGHTHNDEDIPKKLDSWATHIKEWDIASDSLSPRMYSCLCELPPHADQDFCIIDGNHAYQLSN